MRIDALRLAQHFEDVNDLRYPGLVFTLLKTIGEDADAPFDPQTLARSLSQSPATSRLTPEEIAAFQEAMTKVFAFEDGRVSLRPEPRADS